MAKTTRPAGSLGGAHVDQDIVHRARGLRVGPLLLQCPTDVPYGQLAPLSTRLVVPAGDTAKADAARVNDIATGGLLVVLAVLSLALWLRSLASRSR
ncbi:hypothetical protein AB0M97_05710 [Streptomyces sp. NPDC051207]|uniref:hypothetical protein n=1 Tax=Streptomyces sp. NPDC051207 TaxID=3154641 RepID=UPI0034298FF3